MNYIYSATAGIIQGLTEFLPISSSGHLVLFHELVDFGFADSLAFDVVLHLGTLCALLLFFWSDILRYLFAWFGSIVKWDLKNSVDQRLAWYFLAGTIPAALVGYFYEEIIEAAFRNTTSVAIMLIVFGIILFAADKYSKKEKSLVDVTFNNAIVIGIAQAIALVPGVSRSGITIIAGLGQNLNRYTAARFSFLLSIPIVLGAGTKKVLDLLSAGQTSSAENQLLLVGFIISFIVGYFCIKYFLKFLQQKNSLVTFAVYRVILGLLILSFY